MKRPCPTCGKPAEWEDNPDRPFCSERCRLLDLGAWVEERYVVEGDIADDEGASSSIVDGHAESSS